MKKYAICITLALTASSMLFSPAFALDTPQRSSFDARIRYIDYNPDDVVHLDTVVGIATHILLEPGEVYKTHVMGDSDAWRFTNVENHIFIKPKADFADTNFVLVTNKRVYNFKLKYWPTRNASAVYTLKFRYPDTDEAKVKREELDAALALHREGYNLKYTMSGDTDIAPVNTWDNGEFTYFKFPGSADLPAIFAVDSDGNESIVNRHGNGDAKDIIVLHKTNAKWMLRLGDRALAVFNEGYNAFGVTNSTGTASASVKRNVKLEKTHEIQF